MSDEALTWLPRQSDDAGLGLRERKKRQMRAQLASAATRLFLDRGFDAVRVSDIAAACGVSEKTVFNYFPSKEALLLQRFESTWTALGAALADPAVPPVRATQNTLSEHLNALTGWMESHPDPREAVAEVHRFQELSLSTAGLRAHQLERAEQLTVLTAQLLAGRAGTSPDDPRVQIAAVSLTGLWRVHSAGLTRCLGAGAGPLEIRDRVTDDVARAAEVITAALEPFSPTTFPA
ncbi:TetR/AcrR family transcriptional regulator [Kineosporia succinea]|uniref:AcrR family transcriptional regulator n=1 Tax=Kineosporia succinea TaxID=84632 RepID=A0ABT9NVG7_9ACTN|nr:TetR family transcriptional regulator [Kineosporia succinea]MDP9824421.1 AcrR family transcriptional regulator [Kineosporia succinea]